MDPEVLEKTICINCNEFDTCINTRIQPIFFCEEYDNYLNVQNKSSYNEKEVIVSEKNDYTGLCQNCDNSKTCNFRKTDSTKWYCEEYV